MRKTYRLIFFLFLLAGASFLGFKKTSHVLSFFHSQKQLVTASANEGNQKQISENYGKSPLSFVSNEGQFDSKVAYASRGAGYSIFLTQTEAVLALNKSGSQRTDEQSVIKMQLADVNSTPSLTALEQLPGKVNYFSGSDKTKWQANVPTYAKVQYQGVYKGIDLVYYGNQRQLEYDFIVSPGANPNDIALTYDGAEKAEVNTDGALVLSLDGKEVQMHKPLVYQEVDGVKVEIQGNYLLASDNRVNFQVGVYDTTKPLVIDPVLSYSTYLGGSGGDDAFDFFVDSNGNAFITGRTGSTNFPTVDAQQASYNGGEDVFVTKLDTNGAIAYSTYLGGSGGENAVTIVTDSN